MRQIRYINITDDINSRNINDIQTAYNNATKYITEKFSNPNALTISQLFGNPDTLDITNQTFINNQVRNLLIGASSEACSIISSNIMTELNMLGSTDTVKRNAYIKVVYWLKSMFIDILDKQSSIVIYNAPMGKYEMYTLYILSKLGIDILIITKDIPKLKADLYNNVIIEEYHTNENLPLKNKTQTAQTTPINRANQAPINQDQAVRATPIQSTASAKTQTQPKVLTRGKDYNTIEDFKIAVENKTDTFKLKVIGCNDNMIVTLNNFLVWLEKTSDTKSTIIFKHGIPKVSYEDSSKFQRPTANNNTSFIYTLMIYMAKGTQNAKQISDEVCNILVENFGTETNKTKLFNKCITIISWANNYLIKNSGTKTIIHYGKVDSDTELFLELASRIGVSVIAVCTDKSLIKLNHFGTLDLGETLPLFEFPTGEIREKQATVAYNASKEIDELLYNGQTLGLYRDRQFKTCKSLLISTTYDEIAIYWHQDTQFRPHFEVKDNVVTVPNFFVKLSGCLTDYSRYLEEISRLVDEHTIVYKNPRFVNANVPNRKMEINHAVAINGTLFKEQIKMIENHKLKPDVIMGYKNYGYGFLSPDIQYHMLSKIAELLDNKCINYGSMKQEDFEDMVLNILLNLGTDVLRLFQWFDFTKQTPKVVVICQTEETLSLEDTIYLAYLSLMGFDIAVIVPTAYNSVERYLAPNMYEEHILGQPKFDTNIQNLKRPVEPKGLFGRLFGNKN